MTSTLDSRIRSFWQSPVVMGHVNHRITGDGAIDPPSYFARRYCNPYRERALALRWGDGLLVAELLALGACRRATVVDASEGVLAQARASLPPELEQRVEFVCAEVESFRPSERYDVVLASGVLGDVERLEQVLAAIEQVLAPGGLLYVNEYIGPSRFQWTDKQLEIINRLLAALSPDLRRDLVAPEAGTRSAVTRRSIAALIAAGSHDAVRSAELPKLLRTWFEPIEEKRWGGAILHQLLNRIMGNFSEDDELVRVLAEVDALLTDEGVVDSDYLWGVYRLPADRPRLARAEATVDGRLESIEDGIVAGWALDAADLEQRLSVDLYVDHKLVAKATAERGRQDLAREGLGDGAHGYRIALPAWVRDGGQHAISVVASPSGVTVAPARSWPAANRAEPEGTEFAWATHDPELPPLPAGRVLAGRGGWAFPCDDAFGSIEQLLGRLTLTEAELAWWRALLSRRAYELSRLGIAYVVLIAPAKAAIHADRLPESSPALGPPALGRQLREALAGAAVNVADPFEALQEASRERQQYYKRDTGWNYEGAAIAMEQLLVAIRGAGVPARELIDDRHTWIEDSFVGDLAGKPAALLDDGLLSDGPATATGELSRQPITGSRPLMRAPTPTALLELDPRSIVIESPRIPERPTALVMHDQARERLMPFVAPAFSRSVWTSLRALDLALIEAEHPAVVVQILEESQLVRVPLTLGD